MNSNTLTGKIVSSILTIGVISLFTIHSPAVLTAQGKASDGKGNAGQTDQKKSSVPAIKVGSATISKSEFEQRVQRRVQRRKMRQKMMQRKNKGKSGKTPPAPKIDRQKIRQQVKEQTIDQLILEHHANQADITVKQSEVDKEWQKLIDRFGSEKKLKKRLSKTGKNKQDLLSDLKDYLRMKKFIDKNTDKNEVTDKEVRDFYDKNKKRMGNKSFEKMKKRIRQMLEQRKLQEARTDLVEKLKKKTDIDVNI